MCHASVQYWKVRGVTGLRKVSGRVFSLRHGKPCRNTLSRMKTCKRRKVGSSFCEKSNFGGVIFERVAIVGQHFTISVHFPDLPIVIIVYLNYAIEDAAGAGGAVDEEEAFDGLVDAGAVDPGVGDAVGGVQFQQDISPVVDEAFGEAVVERLAQTVAFAVELVGEHAAVDVGQGSHATGEIYHFTLLSLPTGLSPGSPDAPASLDPAILDLAKQETKK